MIELKQINGNIIDLSVSKKFVEHYNKPNSFAKHIIEKEINAGLWYDNILFNLPNDSVIVDAGANVGLFTLYLLPKIKKAYCIEPTNSHIDVLLNLKKSLKLKIDIEDSFLFNRNGSCGLSEISDNTTMNRVSDGNLKQCYTLNSFIGLKKIKQIDLLKLDIEGAEHEVILQDETIGEALKKCNVVYIETHPEPYGHTDEKAIIEKMISLGFNHKRGARDMSHYFTK